MPTIHFFPRGNDSSSSKSTMNPTVLGLLITFVVLISVSILLGAGLFFLRQTRNKRRQQSLAISSSTALVDDECGESGEKSPRTSVTSQSGLTITTTTRRSASGRRTDSFVHVSRLSSSSAHHRQSFLGIQQQAPVSIPEIRITFPDEMDESGKILSSGQVVVVRVGDNSIGMEPLLDGLPPYSTGAGFVPVDLPKSNPSRRS